MPFEVKDLLGRMASAAGDGAERDQYKGTSPRRWFVDNMGAGSYSELLDMFDAGKHDDRWHELWVDEASPVQHMMAEARAVSFMDSGHRSVYEHYMDDEVESMKRAWHYTGNFVRVRPELDVFFTRKEVSMEEKEK